MAFACEDLRQAGLFLVPPASYVYASLLADIKTRLADLPVGAPPVGEDLLQFDENDPYAAILVNGSDKAIAAWSLVWRSQSEAHPFGGSYVTGVGGIPSLLLPFGMTPERKAVAGYWDTILPGSKRYVSSGQVFGINTDVRQPTREEQWPDGVGAWSLRGGRPSLPLDTAVTMKLVLDGVFFSNGKFVGPNVCQLWERIVYDAEVYQLAARVASQVKRESDVLAAVKQVTGEPIDFPPIRPEHFAQPEDFRQRARSALAHHIAAMRRRHGDQETALKLVSWAQTELPQYRRRS